MNVGSQDLTSIVVLEIEKVKDQKIEIRSGRRSLGRVRVVSEPCIAGPRGFRTDGRQWSLQLCMDDRYRTTNQLAPRNFS